MTTQTKARLKEWLLTALALFSAIGIGWSLLVDPRYARATDFVAFQQASAMRSQRDSLNALATARELIHFVDSTAKDLKACIRHPEDCR